MQRPYLQILIESSDNTRVNHPHSVLSNFSASPLVFMFIIAVFPFGLPCLLITPTNSNGYINVDNQFLYVSSQSLEKNLKKISKLLYSIVCFLLFLMLLHLLI